MPAKAGDGVYPCKQKQPPGQRVRKITPSRTKSSTLHKGWIWDSQASQGANKPSKAPVLRGRVQGASVFPGEALSTLASIYSALS